MGSVKKVVKTLLYLTDADHAKARYKTWCNYMTEEEKQGFSFSYVEGYISKGKGKTK